MITHKNFSLLNIKFLLNIQTNYSRYQTYKKNPSYINNISVRDQFRNINGKSQVFKFFKHSFFPVLVFSFYKR